MNDAEFTFNIFLSALERPPADVQPQRSKKTKTTRPASMHCLVTFSTIRDDGRSVNGHLVLPSINADMTLEELRTEAFKAASLESNGRTGGKP